MIGEQQIPSLSVQDDQLIGRGRKCCDVRRTYTKDEAIPRFLHDCFAAYITKTRNIDELQVCIYNFKLGFTSSLLRNEG